MPVADTKKVQTMVNIVGLKAEQIRLAVTQMKAVRTAFNAANPDVSGTPLEGNLAAISNAIDALDSEIYGVVWDGLIDAIVDSHRGEAL